MATSTSMIAPATLPLLANTAAVIGLMPTFIGVVGILAPRTGLKSIQSMTGFVPKDENLAIALVRAYGARDLVVGVAILGMWYYGENGEYRALGLATLVGTTIAAADGYASKKVTGGGEWMHWPLVPVMLGVGLGLLGWI